jgi:hypothetical protein
MLKLHIKVLHGTLWSTIPPSALFNDWVVHSGYPLENCLGVSFHLT